MAISRARYQRLLYDAAISVGVVVRLGCRATEINESVPSVTLASGETLSADLVIGADGKPFSSHHRLSPISLSSTFYS
jgi:salicylate hydroxylase